jgi:Outer membrane protein beta-barrel domain
MPQCQSIRQRLFDYFSATSRWERPHSPMALAVITLSLLITTPHANAAGALQHPLLAEAQSTWQPPQGILLAQAEGDDAYDPFADYSEFEEAMDEEEDINFFRNGRLMTMGFLVGYRGWTQTLQQIYTGNATFGLFMSYFFDLRFALQFGYLTSDHTLYIAPHLPATSISGTINITDISIAMKYFLNTQNVTRGLADLNPYLLIGFSQIYRTYVVSGNPNFAKDSAFAFDVGAGIEVPIMRNKMYLGAQVMYQLINFADEGQVIYDNKDNPTGVYPAGDGWNALGVIGINF